MQVFLALAVLAASFAGCSEGPAPTPFRIYVRVESDPGMAVTGATVWRASKPVATTGADGRAMLALAGTEGETTDVTVQCPETLTSPTKPLTIRLSRLADENRIPEYQVACPPLVRHVVVGVRAENGPNLPVLYLNRPVARTDASGAAHFALEVAPGTQFQVTLDTSEKGNERMRPQSPTRPFTVTQADEIMLFEQRFELEKRAVYRAPPKPIPRQIN